MAIVRIELYAGRTREQKENAAREISEAMARTLDTTLQGTQIVFVDVDKSNWANGGELADRK